MDRSMRATCLPLLDQEREAIMEPGEDLRNGDWITTCFGEEEYAEYVPSWLEARLRQEICRNPDVYSWEDEILFEIGVGLAPHLRDQAAFDAFIKVFDGQIGEGRRFKNEMEEAVERYAEWVRRAFLQEVAQRKREEELRSRCVLCRTSRREEGREVCLNCQQAYWKEEQRLKVHLYRARKAGLSATLTLAEWLDTLDRYQYRCAYCSTGFYEVLEHYIPLTAGSPGGGTTKENCVPSCQSCNAKKRNEHPEKNT